MRAVVGKAPKTIRQWKEEDKTIASLEHYRHMREWFEPLE